jgi:hypothetical protein
VTTPSAMPSDIIEFEYQDVDEAHPLEKGCWSWKVIDNRRVPVTSCGVCGSSAYFPAEFTIASDGLIASRGGRGFTCRNAKGGCPVKGRYLLKDFKAHRKAVD